MQLKQRTAATTFGYLNFTAMGFDDGSADGHPQPNPALCTFFVNAEKLVENLLLQALVVARPPIRQGSRQTERRGFDRNINGQSCTGLLVGVVQQVHHDLLKQFDVDMNQRRIICHMYIDLSGCKFLSSRRKALPMISSGAYHCRLERLHPLPSAPFPGF